MLNVNVRKLILVSILIVSLLALVFLWPFSMRIVSDAEDYQEVAKRALDNSTRQLSALVTDRKSVV